MHGRPRATQIAGHRLYLYPIFHPAAALYTPANLATLKEDFLRLPDLLAHAAPGPGEEAAAPPAAERPAWRPPDHLRAQTAGPALAPSAAPTLEDAAAPTLEDAAAPTLESVAVAAPTLEDAPVAEPWETVATAVSAPEIAAAPAAEATPAPENAASPIAETDPAPDVEPDPAPTADPTPAPQAAPTPAAGPPAEPEQLGLF